MKNYHQKLEPGCYYHVYNRANGSEELFSSDYNYKYFLQKYNQAMILTALSRLIVEKRIWPEQFPDNNLEQIQ